MNNTHKKRRKWPWILVGTLSLLLVALLLFGRKWILMLMIYFMPLPPLNDPGIDIPGIDPSKEIRHMVLGNYKADIPMNYFWNRYMWNGYRWWHASPERAEWGPTLTMLLPGLKPWTRETAAEFDKPTGDTIDVTLQKERNPNWPFAYFRNVGHRLKLVGKSDEAPGLLHYRDTMKKHDDIFLESDKPKHGMMKVICSRGDEINTFASCKVLSSKYGRGLQLSYYYRRRFLPQWRIIDTGLKQLFDQFKVNPKTPQ